MIYGYAKTYMQTREVSIPPKTSGFSTASNQRPRATLHQKKVDFCRPTLCVLRRWFSFFISPTATYPLRRYGRCPHLQHGGSGGATARTKQYVTLASKGKRSRHTRRGRRITEVKAALLIPTLAALQLQGGAPYIRERGYYRGPEIPGELCSKYMNEINRDR